MSKLIIDRAKWNRGGKFQSALLNEHGMCCLGFYCLVLGLSKDDIEYATMPDDINYSEETETKLDWLVESSCVSKCFLTSGTDAANLAGINDDSDISDSEREQHIVEIFAKHDVEVEFIN